MKLKPTFLNIRDYDQSSDRGLNDKPTLKRTHWSCYAPMLSPVCRTGLVYQTSPESSLQELASGGSCQRTDQHADGLRPSEEGGS